MDKGVREKKREDKLTGQKSLRDENTAKKTKEGF